MKVLEQHDKRNIRAAIFDFDGTLSTLRCGWETVMGPMMEEYLSKTENVKEKVSEFIDASTGIQTILQMKWLAEQVALQGENPLDPWDYKAEYNRRLMENVEKKRAEALSGARDKYIISGAEEFLKALKDKGIKLYAASGTDDKDVKKEAEVLGLSKYFDSIEGAKPFSENCSKEATIKELMEKHQGNELLVVGDGPVEIRLGKEAGALTLGICANEKELSGWDEAKINRLTKAGARLLVDRFDVKEIISWMEE
jgi:phosphoglycolate phosphatase-like HAD superfamily hydrolase